MNTSRLGAAISCAGSTQHLKSISKHLENAFVQGDFQPYTSIQIIEPILPCETATTAGASAERASLLSYCLTRRDLHLLWATRGGYGTTSIWSYLKNILPPILPKKYFVGYSDNSYIGNLLSFYFKNITYVHYRNALDLAIGHSLGAPDLFLFKEFLKNEKEWSVNIPLFPLIDTVSSDDIEGYLFPMNLSLAESLCSLTELKDFSSEFIWFIEDCNEDTYCLLRKIDSLLNHGFLFHAKAIVIGELTHKEQVTSPQALGKWIHQKTGRPVFKTNRFGHGYWNVPLVSGSRVKLKSKNKTLWEAQLSGVKEWNSFLKLPNQNINPPQKIHFVGVGGTGMAAVAGVAEQAGFHISGSDGKLYPPMDAVIASLPLTLNEGYSRDFVKKEKPDLAIIANSISRKSLVNKGNEELEWLLENGVEFFSFPSFLNRSLLQESTNIVICGTHGKTTTTSYVSHILVKLGNDPSFIIGGTPIGFEAGFHLGKDKTFVLEGDEYDSAFFDKGPKFLNYNPKIAILGNIEYDHADIYPNVESIENEFINLIEAVQDNNGVIIANIDCPRVSKILKNFKHLNVFSYGQTNHSQQIWKINNPDYDSSGCQMGFSPISHPNCRLTVSSQLFGLHNAYNTCAAFTALLALEALKNAKKDESLISWALMNQVDHFNRLKISLESFQGVKRRLEKIGTLSDVEIYDDFAHHPTAVQNTIQTLLNYMEKRRPKGSQLRVCFDPKNATMRRNTLQNEFVKSLNGAHCVYLGKSHIDERIPEQNRFSAHWVAQNSPAPTYAFEDNQILLQTLKSDLKSGDVIVFMSSGSFDGLPYQLLRLLNIKGSSYVPKI